jgi:hypothetical protein
MKKIVRVIGMDAANIRFYLYKEGKNIFVANILIYIK